jgi:plastocyanin
MQRKTWVVALGASLATAVSPAVAGASTKIVYAGGPAAFQKSVQTHYGAGVNAFFTPTVTIHQGDTVKWEGLAAGFHTVDLPRKGSSDLPLILPDPTHPVTGSKDAAGNPLWFNGLPSLTFNAALGRPSGGHTYNGSARIDSALPTGPPTAAGFSVKFTKTGTFKYFCDVHYGMGGTVKVVPASKAISAASAVKALATQFSKAIASAKALDKTTPPASTVQLGASALNGVEIFAMFPSTLNVAVGTTVTFKMSADTREVHTASFGDASKNGYLTTLANTFNGPAPDPLTLYPSSPPPAPIVLNTTAHGNGFANTGILDQDKATPNPSSNRITFTAPGTYQYICFVHPFMHGTVVVK